MSKEQAQDEVTRLAFALADEAARSDIECHCQRRTSLGRVHWYHLDSVQRDDMAWVKRAVKYLLLRGHIMRDPDNGDRIRFLGLPLPTVHKSRSGAQQ